MSRVKERAVDSTKGNSTLDPIDYKGDVMVQVWLDSRMLATLSNWLEGLGDYPRFMSEVVRWPLEVLVEHLISEGKLSMVDETSVARRMLQGRYRINLNKSDRGRRNVEHNQALSDRRGRLSSKIRAGNVGHRDIPLREEGRRANVSPEEMEKMVSRVEESIVSDRDIERGKEENEKDRIEELNNAKNSSLLANEDGGVTLKEGMSDEELSEYNKKRDEERIKLERKPINVKDFDLVEEGEYTNFGNNMKGEQPNDRVNS